MKVSQEPLQERIPVVDGPCFVPQYKYFYDLYHEVSQSGWYVDAETPYRSICPPHSFVGVRRVLELGVVRSMAGLVPGPETAGMNVRVLRLCLLIDGSSEGLLRRSRKRSPFVSSENITAMTMLE